MENGSKIPLQSRRSGQESKNSKLPAATRFPWADLPLIAREIILKELASDYDDVWEGDGQRCAAYAAVCTEWQAFFEKITFRKLVLRVSDLDGFGKIVKRRAGGEQSRSSVGSPTRGKLAAGATSSKVSCMPRIHHIWLRVELLPYGCAQCQRPESRGELARNNILLTSTLWKLLDILSTWERMDANHRQQLTLELSAHSPSDSDHLLIGDAEHEVDYPYRAGIGAQRDFIERHRKEGRGPALRLLDSSVHDLNNLDMPWVVDITDIIPNLNQGSAERLISPLDLHFKEFSYENRHLWNKLPEVRMVSSFLMRRQYYRSLDGFSLMKLVRESLRGLRSMRCESWRNVGSTPQAMADSGLGLTLRSSVGGGVLFSMVPSPMETVSIFEDFNVRMHGRDEAREPRSSRVGLKILQLVASGAVNIKNISVSFRSDAKDCLRLESQTLPKLESLALTSQHWLEPTQENTEKLLRLAARAALKMPRLQIMEIWTCGNGHAAIFRYEATGTAHTSACRLTWRCSWDVPEKEISWGSVIAEWRHVASTIAGRELRFKEDALPRAPDQYKTYGGIMHQLKLRNLILDPTSVMQVRMGTGAENEPEVEAWRPSVPDSYWSQQ